VQIADADGMIEWDAANNQATLRAAHNLLPGQYRLQINGGPRGLRSADGILLDGEFLDSNIAGSTSPWLWKNAPSGNGMQGGDYVATFTLEGAPLLLTDFAANDSALGDGYISFSLAGTAEANQRLALLVDGTVRQTMMSDAGGVWSADYLSLGLSSGRHTFQLAEATVSGQLLTKPTDIHVNVVHVPVAENAFGVAIASVAANAILSDARFETSDDVLRLKPAIALDFESQASAVVSAAWLDQKTTGNSASVFVVSVVDVNEPPTDIALSGTAVEENAKGAVVGHLTATDPDRNEFFTYSVGDPRLEIVESTLRLKANQAFDFEAGSPIVVSVTAFDRQGLAVTRNVSIAIQNVPESPTGVQLSRKDVFVALPGVWIGAVRVLDPDPVPSYDFFVSDSRFEILNKQLYLKADRTIPASSANIPLEITIRETLHPELMSTANLELEPTILEQVWSHPHQWLPLPPDVNADGRITPLDALLVINELNVAGPRRLEDVLPGSLAGRYLDVSGDGWVTPLDAALIIGQVNAEASGEDANLSSNAYSPVATLAYLSLFADQLDDRNTRKRR
jgi:hypothetical protein